MLRECVAPSMIKLQHHFESNASNSVLYKMFKATEAGLSYQYHAAWNHVLEVLAVFFEVAAGTCNQIMNEVRLDLQQEFNNYRYFTSESYCLFSSV